jgi:outer membrane lipoprotein LolB
MLIKRYQQLLVSCALVMLVGCAETPIVSTVGYEKVDNAHLYAIKTWFLDGRLVISSPHDSWSANILWYHTQELEKLKLSGPMGQGAVVVTLMSDRATIDRGDGHPQASNQPEQFINQQLGMAVPLQSLRYWALGLPEPGQDYKKTVGGFVQSGWLVDFREMQKIGVELLPKKMTVTNNQVKLKLVIDQWSLHDAKLN